MLAGGNAVFEPSVNDKQLKKTAAIGAIKYTAKLSARPEAQVINKFVDVSIVSKLYKTMIVKSRIRTAHSAPRAAAF